MRVKFLKRHTYCVEELKIRLKKSAIFTEYTKRPVTIKKISHIEYSKCPLTIKIIGNM